MIKACPCVAHHSPPAIVVEEHHVLPLSWGGPDAADNKVAVCAQTHFTIHAILNCFVRAGRRLDTNELRAALPSLRVPVFALGLAERAWAERIAGHPTPYW